jgi:hypothetical protein
MKSCGSLSDTRAKEVDDLGVVGFIVSPNGVDGFAFLRAEYLGTLEVGLQVQNSSPTCISRITVCKTAGSPLR